ncbi:hypothetical protein JAAARDRAFT_209797 [Jaapia argillacea MUCL 33604]|uniref:Uncharacterized protein n=1 Tax=Jaapia argillacea MUCL 33604 TaxID=933084 RepID=A0A067PIV2_9AGAM|nr:hypothetical protein JAAARDRAFT_209797 [Jaapia argillacea MUCL 33604]
MAAFFSKDRRPNTKPRKSKTSSWKDICPLVGSKPLQVLPQLSEVDEPIPTPLPSPSPSTSSSTFHSSQTSCSSLAPPASPLAKRRSPIDVKDIRLAKAGEKRSSKPRPVGWTGVEGFSLDDAFLLASTTPPRPAPSPPTTPSPARTHSRSASYDADTSSTSSCSPDSFNISFTKMGLTFDFPTPPRTSTSTTSSCSSGSASSCGLPITPGSSDDEFMISTPTSTSSHVPNPPMPKFNVKRASIKPLVISNKSMPNLSIIPTEDEERDEDDCVIITTAYTSDTEADDEEAEESDSEWYANEFASILSLCTPLPPTTTPSPTSRPDSQYLFTASNKPCRRSSVVLPETPSTATFLAIGPSAQLDPTFPVRVKRKCAFRVPSRPPPPVPAKDIVVEAPAKSPLMISIPERVRPPPRMSVPADITNDLYEFLSPEVDNGDSDRHLSTLVFDRPSTPVSEGSVYSHPSVRDRVLVSPTSSDTFSEFAYYYSSAAGVVDSPHPSLNALGMMSPVDLGLTFCTQDREDGAPIPETPIGCMYSPILARKSSAGSLTRKTSAGSLRRSSVVGAWTQCSGEPTRALRSRWSTSTLGSIAERQREPMSASSRILRFQFGAASRSRKSKDLNTPTSPQQHTKKNSISFAHLRSTSTSTPSSSLTKRVLATRGSVDSFGAGKSDSGESSSGESSKSEGLRRKPIPVEMFLRA